MARTKLGSLLLLQIVVSLLPFANSQEKCLLNRPEVNPKRYLHFEGQSLNITLEMSSRITQQLTTHAFKIFLQEVLGYPKVEIVYQEDDFDVEAIFERLAGPIDALTIVPRSMINLEVWVPPEFDTTPILDNHHIKECGSVAPPGRFGWFIPTQLSQPIREYDTKWSTENQDIHWTVLRDPKFVSYFDVTDDANLKLIANNSYNAVTNRYHCSNQICEGGMYIPEQCKASGRKHIPCALLLTSNYNATKFVIDHINEMKLYVKVVWLGPNLKTVLSHIKNFYLKRNINKSVIFLTWTPSDIVPHHKKFISVSFASCDVLNSSQSAGCKYEMSRLVKFSWSKLEKTAKIAFEALHRLKFSQEDYDLLLRLYGEKYATSSVSEIACDWLRQRERSWKQWIPSSDKQKTAIYIGGIFPLNVGSSYNGNGILRSAAMAVQAINQNASILSDYTLHLLAHDGQCRANKVMKTFIDYIIENYYHNLVGVLGPACSETVEPLAGVSKYYKTLVISYSAEGASFSDREKYPYFFRTIGENKQYKYVYLQLFNKLGWKRIAALTEDGQKYTEYISQMKDYLEQEKIMFISNTKFPRERETFAMTRYLKDLNGQRARIIIADVFDDVARSVMCEAYKLGMTSKQGYVWFLPLWLNSTWYDTDYFNQKLNESVNCTTEIMIEAINGYFAMTPAYFTSDDAVMQENMTVAEWKTKYEEECNRYHTSISNYGGFAYDAVWTYGLALDNLLKEDSEALASMHSDRTTSKLVNLVKNTDFEGVSGRIKFRGGPSRFSVIHIMQWINNGTKIIGRFYPNISDNSTEILGGTLDLNISAIVWLSSDKKIPNDGSLPPSVCALSGLASFLNVECEMAVIILNLGAVIFLLAVLVGAVWFIKLRYDKKVRLTRRYMQSLGIDLLSAANIAGLDKWEIERESVVINRKLGEGAFGTVYGGEANFKDSGWVAIAVKTLKVGSTTEEKLDFLSEAEVMKRFEHKNIVKLLGVCTKNEPVYTIMEFMLYGDLKTFLLARRHLVNDKISEESEDVSSKKLTSMALDVARGLSYLAELKYVHRDVACRNCLVNAQRTVKLGDFGMTRPTLENDYYKFNRKGMLPVRWMAPESLALGVFTPASDVWSYGILLYEIITFGSFPFQGLSNNQVLEHVKAGNTLTIPTGIKPQLEGLLKSCWNQEGKSRPAASEMVEFLANNPRLLSPCLDAPLSSVQMEDTGQLEMHLQQQFRKCSMPFNFKNQPLSNGLSSVSFDSKISAIRQLSIPDSGVSVQIDSSCPREPLLGIDRSNSLIALSKYVTIQHNRADSGCEQEPDDYFNQFAPNAVTKL